MLVKCFECKNKIEKKKKDAIILVCKETGHRVYKETKVVCGYYKSNQ